jgi:phosphatidylglycerophosphatase A
MKHEIESRKPESLLDYISLAVTTFGVGYLPLAPGTFGSVVGVVIYLAVASADAGAKLALTDHGWTFAQVDAWAHALLLIWFLLFCLLGIWASGRATEMFGNTDPSQAVVDEVIGQLIVFLFVPFGLDLYYVLAGFLLFRLFDIWKPYPIDYLQNLPVGIGVCADDILAGVYGGVCLAVIYAVSLTI